jgi:hypothetical protein
MVNEDTGRNEDSHTTAKGGLQHLGKTKVEKEHELKHISLLASQLCECRQVILSKPPFPHLNHM